MANQANKARKRRAVERSFGAGILMFNEPAGCRAERQADERRRHLLLDASIARRRRGFGYAIGVGHLFSVDCRGSELCDRFAWRASPLRPVLGDQRADPPRLTALKLGCSVVRSPKRTCVPRRFQISDLRVFGRLTRPGLHASSPGTPIDRKSTRLNSSHLGISY